MSNVMAPSLVGSVVGVGATRRGQVHLEHSCKGASRSSSPSYGKENLQDGWFVRGGNVTPTEVGAGAASRRARKYREHDAVTLATLQSGPVPRSVGTAVNVGSTVNTAPFVPWPVAPFRGRISPNGRSR